jgi:hypothetical protein
MKFKYVFVRWVDASNTSGWKDINQKESLLAECIVNTIGLLAAENDKSLLVALSGSGDDILGTLTIPKGWIIKRKNLTIEVP